MILKVCRQMIQSAVEIVDSRHELTQELLAGALAILRSLALDAPLVIQEVGPFAPKLLEQAVVRACPVRRSRVVRRSLDVGHRYSVRTSGYTLTLQPPMTGWTEVRRKNNQIRSSGDKEFTSRRLEF
jgi:hypothetical protein